jgi:biotin synthase
MDKLYNDIINGKRICYTEAIDITQKQNCEAICALANKLRIYFSGNHFELCSIVNAKSGKCTEDCKWCAQSLHYKTNVSSYEVISKESAVIQAINNQKKGVHRFSLVTSGRKINEKNLGDILEIYKDISDRSKIYLCASMGLLSNNQLIELKKAGVEYYHCNLETARSFFSELCTTHTYEEKINTIKLAQEIGLSVCSGGILGMGETMDQRIELALELRSLNVKSIPLNFLMPIEGTPLAFSENMPDEEILISLAIFRVINPEAKIRFAGGRHLIKHLQTKALRAGVNAALVGDLLTTIGSNIEEDIRDINAEGFKL